MVCSIDFRIASNSRPGLAKAGAGLLTLLLSLPGQAQVAPTAADSSVRTPVDLGRREAMAGRRLPLLLGGYAVGVGTLYAGLGAAWYTGPRVPLHWFNDLPEWQQLDKAGHFWGAFHESQATIDLLRWAGLSERKALWYGSFAGVALQSPIEYFDGRDPAYGASPGDLAANLLGSFGVLGQHLAWGEIRVTPKVSFRLTGYARQRPAVLGKTVAERLLKDYNGQTYWLCTDVGAFLKKESRWPRWLQPALGYGGQEMVYNESDAAATAGLRPYRQYYLSLDVDLRRIPTRHAWLRRVFYAASIVHLPAPALEWNARRGWHGHPFYY
jgi:hypothetical protein